MRFREFRHAHIDLPTDIYEQYLFNGRPYSERFQGVPNAKQAHPGKGNWVIVPQGVVTYNNAACCDRGRITKRDKFACHTGVNLRGVGAQVREKMGNFPY